MEKLVYVIQDELGIHARPGGRLVQEARKQKPTVLTISKGGRSADLTRLMDVMGLATKKGDAITITAEGGDEKGAIALIGKFLQENL